MNKIIAEKELHFDIIQNSDIFLFTVGVAPVWFTKATNKFVYAPDVKKIEDFYQKTLTVEQSFNSLKSVIKLIRCINSHIKIVITLSPVALARTFEFHSAIYADCISKSTLRVAIHQLIDSRTDDHLIYFPSFEIVRWLGSHIGGAFSQSQSEGPPRDVSAVYLDLVISSFLRNYYVSD